VSTRSVGKRNYENMMSGGSFYAYYNPFNYRRDDTQQHGGGPVSASTKLIMTVGGVLHAANESQAGQFLSDDPEQAKIMIATTLAFLVGIIQVENLSPYLKILKTNSTY
jgi:hypothetical protein